MKKNAKDKALTPSPMQDPNWRDNFRNLDMERKALLREWRKKNEL
jgi:hypothetical protein